jgi:hypothetical protein
MIAANNGYLLAFDSLSDLPVWLSDALRRLASGGSFAVRQLYTDGEEVLFEAARPILLNGIEEVISRPDLGDRAIFLTLAPIGEAQRRPESELWREFEIARPRILGALRGGGSISPLEKHADFLLGLIEKQPDLTLDEVVLAMRKHKIAGSRTAVWRFFKRHKITFKKTISDGRRPCGRGNVGTLSCARKGAAACFWWQAIP